MADPIDILAIAGLVYAGRKLSKTDDEQYSIEGNSIQGQEEVRPPQIEELYSRDMTIEESDSDATSTQVETE